MNLHNSLVLLSLIGCNHINRLREHAKNWATYHRLNKMGNTITEALWGIEAYKSPTRNQIVNGNPDRNKYKNKKEQLRSWRKREDQMLSRTSLPPTFSHVISFTISSFYLTLSENIKWLLQHNATQTYTNGIKDNEVDVYSKQLLVVTHMKTLSMDR